METKEEPTKNENTSSSLSEDDWKTLDFNPTFIGEYKVLSLSFIKQKNEPEKKISTPLIGELKNTFMNSSTEEIMETIKPNCYDIQTYEAPLTPENMVDCYGPGYTLLKKSRFNGKGCGKFEKGIQVSLDSGFPIYTFRLRSNPQKQPLLLPLNVNHIYSGHVKLINPNLLDFYEKNKMDIFPDDEFSRSL